MTARNTNPIAAQTSTDSTPDSDTWGGVNWQEKRVVTGALGLEAVRRHIMLSGRLYFPELCDGFRVKASFPFHSTYPIAKFELDDGIHRMGIVAKWAPVFQGNNEGLTEFANYLQFNSMYCVSGVRFRCPRVLNFLTDQNVLLTEEEPGSTLRYILCHPAQFHDLPDGSFRCTLEALAQWLKAFHRIDSTRISAASGWLHVERAIPWLSSDFIDRDDVIALLGRDRVETLKCARDFAQRAVRCPGCNVGRLHNDYGPGNIVVNAHRVTVLDAAWNRPGVQLSDVAYFTTCISLMGALHVRSARWRQSAVEQFLCSYFRDNGVSPETKMLLVLLRLEAVLRELARHVRRIEALPFVLRPGLRLFCRRVYREAIGIAATDAHIP